ncbi:hypothetical protein HFO98_16195 [Rhizobium leguminosarum]|nr:hypothetical protein [Rhizobium leguminosarum]MBY5409980.1 hypothetical protein [Rhizobium leguminosarum]
MKVNFSSASDERSTAPMLAVFARFKDAGAVEKEMRARDDQHPTYR